MIPKVSVIVPTLGKSPHLRGLLERLKRQRLDGNLEVLVVANIPQQPLREFVNSMDSNDHSHFEYLETGRLGVNLARNRGIDRARGKIIIFLDDDMILDDDLFLKKHFDIHESNPTAAAAGGPYRLIGSSGFWDTAYHNIADQWLRRHITRSGQITQLLGGNISIKKDLLKRNNWSFEETIGFGGAETGLCLRISLAGYPMIFSDEISIGHSPNMSLFKFCRKAFLQGAGARWHDKNIPKLKVDFVNLHRQQHSNTKFNFSKNIYRIFFDFGWSEDPYARPLKGGALPTIQFFAFSVHLIKQLHPLMSFRSWHRSVYVALRSAWLNGNGVLRSVKREETERQK